MFGSRVPLISDRVSGDSCTSLVQPATQQDLTSEHLSLTARMVNNPGVTDRTPRAPVRTYIADIIPNRFFLSDATGIWLECSGSDSQSNPKYKTEPKVCLSKTSCLNRNRMTLRRALLHSRRCYTAAESI